ncbi:MAG: metallophosphoesterase family protein, partial [Parachlamydiaceae bacterium]|nr:metallophosphoesterase family protein [Parachlamydiaceae bacterium]
RFLIIFISFASYCRADFSSDTVYLTWQNDPTTTMTIQWISKENASNVFATYALKSNPQVWMKVDGTQYKIPGISKYFLQRIEITNLEPDTQYLFKIPSTQNVNEIVYQFKTAPLNLKNDIRFVEGGDMYHDGKELMAKTCIEAAKTNPLFALLGGDIAYAIGHPNHHIEKVDRWIDWIQIWHATMISPEGNLIPVISAIGNHDLIGQFNQTPRQAAVFSLLFPMPGSSIYNVIDFGSYLSIILLDSGHATPIKGTQTEWLRKTLNERQEVTYLVAAYHVPAYSSVRSFQNPLSSAIRRYWIPLFEKGGVRAVFEHHDHAYKRTFPLLNNKVNPDGIVYLGDGSWGVKNTRISPRAKKRFYIAKFSSVRHFILTTISPTQMLFQAINDKGEIFDTYALKVKVSEVTIKP